ncbi:glutaredoxin 3 [Arboricoccus pini]|uniref:Glutaredoxin n=1 Tax=Arboricoccus pini TaxID=1963835 RepID=A0A212QZU8_9PROT|nr:glutaredoxin 3 [Arboricoccus pini]SNB65278.1 glutaredoxin 3 [Arboricoccus pini]
MPAAEIVIYTQPLCGYCSRAKHLLDAKGLVYEEIDLFAEPAKRREMLAKSGGRRTVPQIFIGTTHVGGCDDLVALDRAGKLDALLATIRSPAEQS